MFTKSTRISAADVFIFLIAIGIGLAVLTLPWGSRQVEGRPNTGLTVFQTVSDTLSQNEFLEVRLDDPAIVLRGAEEDSEIDVRISDLLVILLPVAAVIGILAGLWGMVTPSSGGIPRMLALIAGVMAMLYFVVFILEGNGEEMKIGFLIAMAGSVALLIQMFISRAVSVSIADVAVIVIAAIMGLAFYQLPYGTEMTGGGAATGEELLGFLTTNIPAEDAVQNNYALLMLIPLAAVIAAGAGFFGLVSPSTRKSAMTIAMVAGGAAALNFIVFYLQNDASGIEGLALVQIGFWIMFAAALGLIAQAAIPRQLPLFAGDVDGFSKVPLLDSLKRSYGTYAFLFLISVFVLLPMLIAVSQSFMTNQAVNRWPPQIIPSEPTFQAFNNVLTQQDLRLDLWLRNSLFAASGYTVAVLILCAPAAYAFARLNFPGNRIIFAFLLLTIMIPPQITLIPNYLLMRDLKWLDTFNALIFPGAANVFGVFLLRQFFMQIPSELEEAAVLDGAGYWGRFWHVVLPLSTNALTALGIFVFLGHYNDLFWPFIVTNSLETRTLPVGLTILNSSYAGQYRPMVLSGAVLSTIPILIVYIIFQRRIIQGVMLTGMGGR